MTRQSQLHVLLVAYGGGHITMVVPVMRELERRGVRCNLMALTTGCNKARQMGMQPKGYRDFVHLLDNLDEVMAWGDKLADANSHPEVDPLETRLYMGVNYTEWVHEYGEARAAELYAEGGRRAFLPRAFMRRVLADLKPDAVVTTNSPRTEQASIEAAVALGIPVLSMIDLFAKWYDPYLKRNVHADRIAVIDEFTKSNIVRAGVNPVRVVVTGNPAFDSLASPDSIRQAQLLRQRLGWADKKVILFAGQLEELEGTPEHWRGPLFVVEVETCLRQWVAEREDRALIVRYHPNEFHAFPDLGQHPRVYSSQPGVEALHPVLLASDAVVVQTSTVGLEAAISGRKVLSLSFSPAVRPDFWDYGEMGLGTSVPLLGDLTRLIDESLALVDNVAGDYQVGSAAIRVSDETMNLIQIGNQP